MARHSHKSTKRPSKTARNQHPRSLQYYLSGAKNHLKLGKFATNAYVQMKDLLSKEISIPSINPLRQPQVADTPEASTEDSSDENPPTSKQKTMEEIKKITKKSNEVLCSAKTVFPFSFFTDHIVLDRTKLTITKHDFFMSSQVMSIRIEDILNVSTDVGPFLGSINVAIRIMNSDDHISVNNLRRRDAIHLKHIIQGYVIAQHNKIDVAHLNHDELVETLTELGHDLSI